MYYLGTLLQIIYTWIMNIIIKHAFSDRKIVRLEIHGKKSFNGYKKWTKSNLVALMFPLFLSPRPQSSKFKMDWSHNTHLNDVLVFMCCMGNQHHNILVLKIQIKWNNSHVNKIFTLNGSNLMLGNLTWCWFSTFH